VREVLNIDCRSSSNQRLGLANPEEAQLAYAASMCCNMPCLRETLDASWRAGPPPPGASLLRILPTRAKARYRWLDNEELFLAFGTRDL